MMSRSLTFINKTTKDESSTRLLVKWSTRHAWNSRGHPSPVKLKVPFWWIIWQKTQIKFHLSPFTWVIPDRVKLHSPERITSPRDFFGKGLISLIQKIRNRDATEGLQQRQYWDNDRTQESHECCQWDNDILNPNVPRRYWMDSD